jgi:hypothetical protein
MRRHGHRRVEACNEDNAPEIILNRRMHGSDAHLVRISLFCAVNRKR